MGFVLFAVHNPYQPLKEYTFLPVVGFAFSMLAMLMVLVERNKEVELGDKRIWIPLLVIVCAMAASGFVQLAAGDVGTQEGMAPLAFGVYLFGLYLVARLLKEDLFAPFAGAVVIESVSCVVWGLTHWGLRNGGLVGPTNYDMASGFMILGVLVSAVRRQWWLSAVAMVGLCFAGAEEAMVAIAVLVVVMVVRRDWGRRMLLPVGVLVLGMVILFALGLGQTLYAPVAKKMGDMRAFAAGEEIEHEITNPFGVEIKEYPRYFKTRDGTEWFQVEYDYEWEETLDNITNWRWTQFKRAAKEFSWFGNGLSITKFNFYTVHNVPYCITDQVGPFAGVAWLFVTIFCLVKTRWKYLWTAVIALSMFDHYLFTQIAPWWWVFVGVSSVSAMKSDSIFKSARANGADG